jgi:Zn-dependent protease
MVEARVAHVGQGAGRGAFWSPMAGDEVVVLLPGGDPARAVVLGSLGGVRAPHPVAVTGVNAVLMHPGGVELRTADALPAHGIVLGALLPDLLAFVTALQTFMAAVVAASASPPASAVPAIGTAATAFSADPSVVALLAGLTTSSAPTAAAPPGVGGPPYASPLNRSTL